MLIVCPKCATSYQVEGPSLGRSGRSVRCARCRNVWFAARPVLVPAMASAGDFDVVDAKPKIISFFPPPESEGPAAGAAEADAVLAEVAPPGEQAQAMPGESPGIMAPDAAKPEAASTEGIDLESLKEDMAEASAEQAAAADAVLSAVPGEEITVAEAPPIVPPDEPVEMKTEPPPVQAAEPEVDIEALAARRARRQMLRRRKQQWPLSRLPTLILALVAANTVLMGWRMDIVRLLPQTASFYSAVGLPVNLRGLAFEGIKMSKEEQDGMPVLVVEGSITNVTRRAAEVPRIRLAVRNERKNEIYSWTTQPQRSILGPGETLPFRARLASPPAETRDVMVRFFTRRDVVAGIN